MDKKLLDPLIQFLKIPSVSTQEKYLPDMQSARNYLVELFSSMGFKTKILKGIKHDAVFAELAQPLLSDGGPTVLIYGHYDVQPAEPLNEWKTPAFEPTIKGDEIYARGSADNKGQHMIHIMAIKSLLQSKVTGAKLFHPTGGTRLPVNFKFLIEGEEEIGSPSINDLAKKYSKNLLSCDYLMVSDTGMRKEQPSIDTGLRGLVYTEVSLQTAKHDLHSGEYGGLAENPAIVLTKLINNLKDDKNRVLVPHFYDDVEKLSIKEIAEIKKVGKSEKEIIEEGELLGTGGGESKYSVGERKWTQPTLDVNGIWSGYTGEGSKTIIPYKASAKISMRLVPNQDNDKIYASFEKYVKSLVPKWMKLEIVRHADCLPYKAPTNHKVFDLMRKSLKKVYGKNPIEKRVSGSIGFVPIMAKSLKVPVLMIGFALPGANIHAPNEHFNLTNYYKGIEVMTDFYKALPKIKS